MSASASWIPKRNGADEQLPITGVTYPGQDSDEHHGMAVKRTGELDHELLAEMRVMHETLLTAVQGGKGALRGWAQPLMTALVVGVAVFGVNFVPTSTSQLKEDLRMAKYQIDQGEIRERELRDRMQSQEYIWNNLQKSLSALGVEVDGKTGQIVAVRVVQPAPPHEYYARPKR